MHELLIQLSDLTGVDISHSFKIKGLFYLTINNEIILGFTETKERGEFYVLPYCRHFSNTKMQRMSPAELAQMVREKVKEETTCHA